LYEFIILDNVFAYHNALEAFWRKHLWAVEDIPDPNDDNPARSAFLAGCAHILVRSFNQRIKIGLGRDMRPLITPEEVEEARNLPEHLRRYERVPSWVAKAPPVAEILVDPTNDGVFLVGKDGRRADPDFLAKNVLLWTPHIYFT
jgi:hypothetical protein